MKNDNATVNKGIPKKILLVAIAAIVLLGVLLGVLIGHNEEDPQVTTTPPTDIREVSVTDEETLRKLLLEETELKICVSEDMEVDRQFIVKGTKVLTGDAQIRMSLSAEWGQSLLVVSDGASLFMDGLVLDGNYIADGIHMEENAKLTYLSGTIRCTDVYSIQAAGEVAIQGVNIEKAEYIGIFAEKGSKVTMEGGTLTDTATNDIYVAAGAVMDITGNAQFKGCMGDSVMNYGTINVYDGTFEGANSYTFNNYGVLNIAYTGGEANGYVECSGSRLGVVCTRMDAETNISRLHVTDTTRQAVVTVGGKTVITDCVFEGTGYHAVEIQAGEAQIKNVVVNESKNAGLEVYTKGVVAIEDFTVNGCEGIGIASRGGKITGSKIQISGAGKYGISCGNSTNGNGFVSVTNVNISDTAQSCAYVYGGASMELTDIKISGSKSRGIYVAEDSTCTLSGDSSISNMTYRGVEVRGTFTMNAGQIFDNHVENSGAGVYVSEKGNFIMNGGSIYNNTSALRGGGICVTEGKVTINYGEIYNNSAKDNGGGLYAQKTAVVLLNEGCIKGNRSAVYGNGIYIASAATKVTMSGNFYVGGNDVKLGNVESVLEITGEGLKKHSASDPLLLTPSHSAKEGTVVATYESESVAQAVLPMVASGDGSYKILQSGKNMTIAYTAADMDMTGADTVYVSSFEELKAAVEGTASKRYIVLNADVVFTERIRLPGGVTICIKDDGTKRTLSRGNGFTDNLFVTHYGTGLCLEATEQGKLVLDGAYTSEENAIKVQPLIRVAGSTVLRNVVLQNNGVAAEGSAVRGALLRQLSGDFEIYNSILTGGACESGGAIMIDKGIGYIEKTTLSKNESVIGGGAIRAAANTQLVIVDSVFDGNHAGSSGGAFVAVDGAKVTVTDTKFVNNTAASFGGAANAQGEGTSVIFEGTDGETAIFANNSTITAGALCVHTKAQLMVSGYTFTENKATDGRAGAIAVNSGAVATIENSGFYKNESSGSGGALSTDGGKISVVDCELGKTGAGNTAGDKGGAILVTGNGSVDLIVTKDGKLSSMSGNTAIIGGAICVYDGQVSIDGYTLSDNQAKKDGGAVYVEAGAKMDSSACVFEENTAAKKGGAVYMAGVLTDTDSTYRANESEIGGAVALAEDAKATISGEKGQMIANVTTAPGAAIYVSRGAEASVNGYTFKDNVASSGGAIYIYTCGKLTTENAVFEGNVAKKETDTGIEYGNGGAVQVLGTYVDKNSSFIGNMGKNGGAVIVMTDGKATMTGTVSDTAFSGNEATGNGGAVFVNIGGTLELTGYGFDKNAAALGGAAYISKESKVTIKDVAMEANTANRGAAIYSCGPVTVTGSVFEKNIAQKEGGAIYAVADSDVTVQKCEFVQNEGITGGGAIYVEAGAVVTNSGSVFTENTSTTESNGGAVHVKGTYLDADSRYEGNTGKNGGAVIVMTDGKAALTGTAADAVFTGNEAAVNGGAIFVNIGGTLDVTGYGFNKNEAVLGGAVYTVKETNVTITDVVMEANTANRGAAIYSCGPVSVTGSTFEKNVAEMEGGAIYAVAGSEVAVEKCAFTENTGVTGGGALYVEADAAIENASSTFTKNSSSATDGNGGAVHVKGTYVDENSTYTGNTGKNGGAIIVMTDGVVTMTGSGENAVLAENEAAVNGGAIYVNKGGKLDLIGYRFAENTAVLGGAVYIVKETDVAITDTTMESNTANKGAAIYSCGPVTITGSTFEKNAAEKEGGAIYAVAGSDVAVEKCGFTENESTTGGGAIYVEADATVTNTGSVFIENTSTADGNGGAVHVKGAYIDENSSYAGNTGKNGGAIAVLGGGSATLTGTDANAIFEGNEATVKGSAVFVNTGSCTASITGYTFTGNTTGTGAVYVVSGGSGKLKNVSFIGQAAQTVNADGTLTINNVTGTTIKHGANTAGTSIGKIYIEGFKADNDLTVVPYKYEDGLTLLQEADGAEEGAFAAARSGMVIKQDGSDNFWIVDNSGKLRIARVMIGNTYYSDLSEAVNFANQNGGTGDAADVVIRVITDLEITKKIEIKKNITIVNEGGKDITISRGFTSDDMFYVAAGKLTLGTNDANETGKLIVDAATTNAISARTVDNRAGATFVLARNATLKNAKCSVWGSALVNRGEAHLYGSIVDNTCVISNAAYGGAVLHLNSATKLIIHEGTYTGNSTTDGEGNLTIGVGGFLNTQNGSGDNKGGSIEIHGGTFGNNKAMTGGAVYVGAGITVTITGCTFSENEAKQGGAIYTLGNLNVEASTANGVTFTLNDVATGEGGAIYAGADAVVIITGGTFSKNEAKYGGAIYTLGELNVESETTGGVVFSENKANGAEGGAIYVCDGSEVIVENATFYKNQGSTAGAIFIAVGGEVKCENVLFDQNTSPGNGGAVHVKGTYTDTNSTYTGNTGKNGGAIAVLGGGNATVSGTNADTATFSGNIATGDSNSRGAAILVNNGQCAVSGYTFTGNTSGNGAVSMDANGVCALTDVVFNGNDQKVVINGTLTFSNVTGATFEQGTNGKLYVAGFTAGNQLMVVPGSYADAHVVLQKAAGAEDSVLTAACAGVQIVQKDAVDVWILDAEGKLRIAVARIGDNYYADFPSALSYANTNGGTGDAADITIYLLKDVSLTAEATISKNITIVNEAGKTIKITRASSFTGAEMLTVAAEGKLTLGTNDTVETGKLIVDATTSAAITKRSIENNGVFVLARNASLENAWNNQWGSALINKGTSHLYGSIKNNKCTGAGGAVLMHGTNGSVIIYEGTYTGNTATRVESGSTTASYGGFLRAYSGSGTLEIRGGTFENNSATGRGGVLYCEENTTVIITGGTFANNTSGDGSAVYILAGGNATMKDAAFTGNTAQQIFVGGSLTINNVSGTTIVQGENGSITLAGFEAANELTVVPYAYTAGHVVLLKADGVTDAVFTAACSGVTVASDGSDNIWFVDEDGKLAIAVARIGETYYADFTSALSYANTNGGTGDATDAVIHLLKNVELTAKATVSKNITIVNESGKDIKISRATAFTGDDMFNVAANGKLTLGTNDTAETGKLFVDATTSNVIAKRIVDNSGIFTLARNASLENAKSNQWGTVLVNRGTTHLYGSIKNNECTGAGGAILQTNTGKTITIYEGNYSGNTATRVASGSNTDGYGGFLRVQAKSSNNVGGPIEIKGGTFEDNFAVGRGGALYWEEGTTVTITGGTFSNNEAKQGGAIYTLGTLKVEPTAANGVTFTENAATSGMGGAIYADKGSNVTVKNSEFTSNTSTSGGAAIYIEQDSSNSDNDASVSCENVTFTSNNSTANGNGGAIHCKGTFIGTNCKFTANIGKNGGMIAVMDGGSATFTGSLPTAVFENNQATATSNARGAAIFVNSGCSVDVSGYTFTNNTTGNGAVYIGGSGTLKNLTFTVDPQQKVVVTGALEYWNITGATLEGTGTKTEKQ